MRKVAFKFLLVEDNAEMREIITDYFAEKSGGALVISSAEKGRAFNLSLLPADTLPEYSQGRGQWRSGS